MTNEKEPMPTAPYDRGVDPKTGRSFVVVDEEYFNWLRHAADQITSLRPHVLSQSAMQPTERRSVGFQPPSSRSGSGEPKPQP